MGNLTINDIAKKAGTSRSTVSRVINGRGDVSESTRKKVLKIIEEENYIPSAVARGLSKKESNLIGVVVPAVDNPFFGGILRGITQVLDDTDYIMMCYNTDDDFEKDIKALEVLSKFQVEGLLYTPAIDYDEEEKLNALQECLNRINATTVLMDRDIEKMDLSGVFFKDTEAVYYATDQLIKAGHTDIGFVSGVKGNYLPRRREAGYLKALEDNGIPFRDDLLVYGHYEFDRSYSESKKLLALDNRPTAVITSNNMTTNTFLKALNERGESSPEDIIIIGLDEIETLNIVDDTFNYIERDSIKMGRMAAEMMLEDMKTRKSGLSIEANKVELEAPVKIRHIKKGM